MELFKIRSKLINKNLNQLFKNTAPIKINDNDKFVIFNDLHMGNGKRGDAFAKNSELFSYVLKNYYLANNYKLVLNGDVEELHKFALKKIIKRWDFVFKIFDAFKKRNNLYKISGNHDIKLNSKRKNRPLEALKLSYKNNIIFIFHGHQASNLITRLNTFVGLLLHYVAKPLHIKHREIPYNSKIKFKTEKNVYNFSCQKKIISIIGHTHRPLFQSMSKIDLLRFEIDQLCRHYPEASKEEKKKIEESVDIFKNELMYYHNKRNRKEDFESTLYNARLYVPSLFNSGCVTSKRGLTAIEINNGRILLTHWFNKNKIHKYLKYIMPQPHELKDSVYYRITFNQELLSYIFTRIKLLTGID